MKEEIFCLRQEKGRNVILGEGFPWKEKAEESGIPAWKIKPKRKDRPRKCCSIREGKIIIVGEMMQFAP